MNHPAKKIVLVTGCISGFGLLTAVEMARAGFNVFASVKSLNERKDLDAAAAKAGVKLEVLELDVTKENTITAAVNHINAAAGPIDMLINIAGVGIMGFAEETSLSETREIFEVNLFGVIAVTKAVYPQMRERHSGQIITISSSAARFSGVGLSTYSATKYGIEGYMEALYCEGMLDGINVSLVEPGFYKTEILGRNKRIAAKALDPASPHFRLSKKVDASATANMENKQDPLDVARLIVKIASTKKPHLRYLAGKDAKFLIFLKQILPTSIFYKLASKLASSGKKI